MIFVLLCSPLVAAEPVEVKIPLVFRVTAEPADDLSHAFKGRFEKLERQFKGLNRRVKNIAGRVDGVESSVVALNDRMDAIEIDEGVPKYFYFNLKKGVLEMSHPERNTIFFWRAERPGCKPEIEVWIDKGWRETHRKHCSGELPRLEAGLYFVDKEGKSRLLLDPDGAIELNKMLDKFYRALERNPTAASAP